MRLFGIACIILACVTAFGAGYYFGIFKAHRILLKELYKALEAKD